MKQLLDILSSQLSLILHKTIFTLRDLCMFISLWNTTIQYISNTSHCSYC